MKRFLLGVTILFSLSFCTDKKEVSTQLKIVEANKVGTVIFELDSLTPNMNNHMHLVDDGSQAILYVLTPFKNRIVGFDFKSGEKVKEIEFKSDPMTPLKIGGIMEGFYYHNSDSIFLFNKYRNQVMIGNDLGEYRVFFDFLKDFPDTRENRTFWTRLTQNNIPFIVNDSLMYFGGNYDMRVDGTFDVESKTELMLNFNDFQVTKQIPVSSAYIPGNYYMINRVRASKTYWKELNRAYFSFPNADSVLVKDFNTGEIHSFWAEDPRMIRPKEYSDQKIYANETMGKEGQVAQDYGQGGYPSIFFNPYKNQIVRSSFLGIKNFEYDRFMAKEYVIHDALHFYDAATEEYLGTIDFDGYMDERFVYFDENNFYAVDYSNYEEEDQMVLDKYAYPDFN